MRSELATATYDLEQMKQKQELALKEVSEQKVNLLTVLPAPLMENDAMQLMPKHVYFVIINNIF